MRDSRGLRNRGRNKRLHIGSAQAGIYEFVRNTLIKMAGTCVDKPGGRGREFQPGAADLEMYSWARESNCAGVVGRIGYHGLLDCWLEKDQLRHCLDLLHHVACKTLLGWLNL